MSTSQIEAFAMEIGRNPELQKKIDAIRFDAEPDVIRQLVELSTQAGTPVSAEEWAATFVRVSKKELDDADLDKVVGGTGILSWLTSLLDVPVEIRMN